MFTALTASYITPTMNDNLGNASSQLGNTGFLYPQLDTNHVTLDTNNVLLATTHLTLATIHVLLATIHILLAANCSLPARSTCTEYQQQAMQLQVSEPCSLLCFRD